MMSQPRVVARMVLLDVCNRGLYNILLILLVDRDISSRAVSALVLS